MPQPTRTKPRPKPERRARRCPDCNSRLLRWSKTELVCPDCTRINLPKPVAAQ